MTKTNTNKEWHIDTWWKKTLLTIAMAQAAFNIVVFLFGISIAAIDWI